MIELPKDGSAWNSFSHVFSLPLKKDYARLMGVNIREASFIIDHVGAVIQDRLLRGLPCGIPFVGVLHIQYTRGRRFTVKGVSHMSFFPDKGKKSIEFPLYAQPKLFVSEKMRILFRDSVPYTGNLKDHYHKTLESEREIAAKQKIRTSMTVRKHYGYGPRKAKDKYGNTYIRTGRPCGNPNWRLKKEKRMAAEEARKARLMVEDANAIECDKNGKDVLVRAHDRKATVKNMKESKGKSKPLHD